jgi:hypothetical protein
MTRDDWQNGVVGFVGGSVFGGALLLLSLRPMGGGHGTYLPVALFGAPLSLVGGDWPSFVEVVLVWAAIGFLLGAVQHPGPAATLLLVQLAGMLAVLKWGSRYALGEEQWQYFERAEPYFGRAISVAVLTYAVGHLSAWIWVAVKWVKRRRPVGSAG